MSVLDILISRPQPNLGQVWDFAVRDGDLKWVVSQTGHCHFPYIWTTYLTMVHTELVVSPLKMTRV